MKCTTAYWFFFLLFLIEKLNSQNLIVTFDLPQESYFCVNSGIITLPLGLPEGGIYKGIGVAGNLFDTNLYPGIYEIQYHYTDPQTGIIMIASSKLSLQRCVSLNNTENQNNINIFPNGTTTAWILENGLGLQYELVNPYGIVINKGQLISTKQVIDLYKNETGLYFLILKDKNGKQEKVKKVSLN